MGSVVYQSLNLPRDLVEELKIWRQAYMISYGRTVSYGEMIRTMLDNLDSDAPDVVKAMDLLVERHPELEKKIGKYRGDVSDDVLFYQEMGR